MGPAGRRHRDGITKRRRTVTPHTRTARARAISLRRRCWPALGLLFATVGIRNETLGAEDPFRFTAVPVWHGSLRVSGDGSGAGAIDQATFTWETHVLFDVRLDLKPGLPGQLLNFEWRDCPSRYSASYSSSVKWNCPASIGGAREFKESANELSWSGSLNPNDCVSLSILGSLEAVEMGLFPHFMKFEGTSQSFNYDCAGRDSDQGEAIFPAMPDEAERRLESLPLPDTGLKIVANWSFVADFVVGGTGAQPVNWNVSVELSGDAEEDELIVEPLDQYETWIPEAKQNEETPANELGFTARLRDKSGGFPSQRAKYFRFELVDTSAVPGVCMNYPAGAGAVSTPDLQFTPERNSQGWKPFAGHGQKIESTDGEHFDSYPAIISSFDWGASAELKVTAVMPNGDEIVGHFEGEPEGTWIPIPRRKKGSRIADEWKRQNGATSLSDDDDGEDEPKGDGHKGDGLTLYEEYRGFYARDDNQHQIGDPKKKDLFIWNWTGKESGIGLFASLSELNVHARIKATQVRRDRVINFNHSGDEPHRVDQHALILLSGALGSGRLGEANGGPGLPRQVSTVVINQSIIPAGPNSLLAIATRSDKIVAHELFHATNVWHHGTGDLRRVTWMAARENGLLVYQEGGETVFVAWEGSERLITPDDENDDMTVWLGVDQGEHSGAEGCVLRYSFATAYRERPPSLLDRRFYLGSGKEPDGFALCSSKDGTGVNGAGHQPQSRYGHAGRGCCSHQVCVNDAETHGGSSDSPRDCPSPGGGQEEDGSIAWLPPAGGGLEDPAPLVSLSANGGVEIELHRGWPVLVEFEMLHSHSFSPEPGAVDLIISPPAGDWGRVIRFSVKNEAGAETPLAFLPQGQTAGPLTLKSGSGAVARYWILPEESMRLAAGAYEFHATLDTASSTEGWIGTATSERVLIRATDEPVPLPPETEALKLLHLGRYHLWRGELDAAGAVLDELGGKFPVTIEGFVLRGSLLEARGRDREALSAYESALDLFLAKFPDAAETPRELLAAYQAVQARIVDGKLPVDSVRFRRGDFTVDGQIDISDPVAILGYLFLGATPDPECLASADGSGDHNVDLTDAVYLLGYLFLGSSEPPAPFPGCGEDAGGEGPVCRRSHGCAP